MKLTLLDAAVFCCYFAGVLLLGLLVAARSRSRTSADYFLASKRLPWYAVGASYIAANISTEHFIGMVGWAFLYGMSVANWCWGNVFTFTLLIWVFLPFYLRGNVSTMPEFLERRYNRVCRHIYAVVSIVGMVIGMLSGVLFGGAKAINALFPQVPVVWAIVILAAAAGAYTIYGGLVSAVWADVVQYCLLMTGGAIVAIYGLRYAGGLDELTARLPEKFIVFYSPRHELIPWTGMLAGIMSVGIWYNCANQFMVQRCLGARSEWDARMGILMAGFSQAFLPFIIVLPGIIAFQLFQGQIADGDQSWPFMVRHFLPAGLVGLVMAGLASAILSTLSAITNSSATIFTLDLYRTVLSPRADDRESRRVGRISGFCAMVVGVLLALLFARIPGLTVFGIIQSVFFYMAGPVAAIFLVGIFWRGATAAAATTALVIGFSLIYPVRAWLFKLPVLAPFDSFTHHTFMIFIISIALVVGVSFFTTPKPAEALVGVIWTKSAFGLPEHERANNRGVRSLGLWWALFVLLIIGLYALTMRQASRTDWLEAEATLAPAAAARRGVRLQPRGEIEGFNLWTGKGQVLVAAEAAEEGVVFTLPVEKPGRYRVAALVTTGPGYGRFTARVNGRNATIEFPVTRGDRKNGYRVVYETMPVFDAGGAEGMRRLAVARIGLGEFELEADARIEINAAADSGTTGTIGIDQWIVTGPLE